MEHTIPTRHEVEQPPVVTPETRQALGRTASAEVPELLTPQTEHDHAEAARRARVEWNTSRLHKRFGEQFVKGERAADGGFMGLGAREILAEFMGLEGFSDTVKRFIPLRHQALKTLRDNKDYLLARLRDHYSEDIEELAEPKDPYELAEQAGYTLTGPFSTVEEFLPYKADFRENELICTYWDPQSRLDAYHIMWLRAHQADSTLPATSLTPDTLNDAWKHYLRKTGRYNEATDTYNLEQLRPARDDPYGTSSMSVQISRTGNHVSVKNRYNHTVASPDNTLDNNLDTLADGLRHAVFHRVNRDDLMRPNDTKLDYRYIADNNEGIHPYYQESNNHYLGYYEYIHDGVVTTIDRSVYTFVTPELYVARQLEALAADRRILMPGGGDPHEANYTYTQQRLADGRIELQLTDTDGALQSTYHITETNGEFDRVTLTVHKGSEKKNIQYNPALTDLTIGKGANVGNILSNPSLASLTIAEGARTQHIFINPALTNLTIAEGASTWNVFDNNTLVSLTIAEGASTQHILNNNTLVSLIIAKGANALIIAGNPSLTNLMVAEGAGTKEVYDNDALTNLTIAEGAHTEDIRDNPSLTNLTIAEGARTKDIYKNDALTSLTIAERASTDSIYSNPVLVDLAIAKWARTDSIYNNDALTNLAIAEGARTMSIYENDALTSVTIAEGACTESIYRNPVLANLAITEGARTKDIHHNNTLANLTIAEGARVWDITNNPALTRLVIAKGASTRNIHANHVLTNLTIAEKARTSDIFDNPALTDLTITDGASIKNIYHNSAPMCLKVAKGASTGRVYDNPHLSGN